MTAAANTATESPAAAPYCPAETVRSLKTVYLRYSSIKQNAISATYKNAKL